jgi:hypothetical protein
MAADVEQAEHLRATDQLQAAARRFSKFIHHLDGRIRTR